MKLTYIILYIHHLIVAIDPFHPPICTDLYQLNGWSCKDLATCSPIYLQHISFEGSIFFSKQELQSRKLPVLSVSVIVLFCFLWAFTMFSFTISNLSLLSSITKSIWLPSKSFISGCSSRGLETSTGSTTCLLNINLKGCVFRWFMLHGHRADNNVYYKCSSSQSNVAHWAFWFETELKFCGYWFYVARIIAFIINLE